jgi:hypothetical protein
MSRIDGNWMGLDPVTGTLAMSVWAAGALAALLVIVGVIAYTRFISTSGTPATIMRYALIAAGVLAVFAVVDHLDTRERAAERRALEARASELTARAIVPGSALACLDAAAGETVEASCESAVFANPEAVAAAVSYVAARLALYEDGLKYATRRDRTFAATLTGLRQAAETDRFGIVAHILATRDRCTAERCPSFDALGSAGRIKLNLRNQTFLTLVARHAAGWNVAKVTPDAAAPVAEAPTGTVPTTAPTASVIPNLNFPSANSIPPISIMDAEPQRPAPPAEKPPPMPGSEPVFNPKPPPAEPRRPARRAPGNGPATTLAPPTQIVPPLPPSTAFDASVPTRAQ